MAREPDLQFDSLESQAHAGRLGLWVFVASEVLFFCALFALYAAYRTAYPGVFSEGTHHTSLALGTVNTYVLVTSSFVAAMALHAVQTDRRRLARVLFAAVILLALAFLGLKAAEYVEHFHEGLIPGPAYSSAAFPGDGARVFFSLYYLMTGLHALHVVGGVVALGWVLWRLGDDRWGSRWHQGPELVVLYWHFVDLIWLFLWPLFYLLR